MTTSTKCHEPTQTLSLHAKCRGPCGASIRLWLIKNMTTHYHPQKATSYPNAEPATRNALYSSAKLHQH